MTFYQQIAPAQLPQTPYGIPSTTIEPTEGYLRLLRSMAHRRDVLVKNGFVVKPLSDADIDDKRRCSRCNMRCSNKRNKFKPNANDAKKGSSNKLPVGSRPPSRPRFNLASAVLTLSDGEEEPEKPPKPVLKCQYHTGRAVRMYYTCCRAHISAPGCTWAPEHQTRSYDPGELVARYQHHHTAARPLLDPSPSTFPSSPPSRTPRPAVAIDCEMGTAYDGESELIRVTLVDYFSSEILLDSLVYPQVAMQHYNTKWSGVSRQQMNDARAKGKCITGGLDAVRAAVWRWVGPDTVVVGHAVHNDLASLRWIHPLVVDSLLLATAARAEREKREQEEEEARNEAAAAAAAAAACEGGVDEDLIAFGGLDIASREDREKASAQDVAAEKIKGKRKPGGLSLKALTAEMFDRQIQKGRTGHDSMEDALAARDIVHWFVMQRSAEMQSQDQGVPVAPGFW
ncbi:Putative ribonuclease H-like superfamily, exonuclease, RNase T/DNA polymerase III [Colletotrichum destructivum]|uniref:Ribonuclease H-like superfamily, exonuclease, RNase T/DNA polymerase III n=1 Tax=Colletotrichum destructivum TaxID=34406 RepID=A0AAX4J3V5_9PEZI|nr:Putative ribonuclease H-like superfamily, exonuclease, RNase T/DNA polymerase III [Colletotrichum destructivum]